MKRIANITIKYTSWICNSLKTGMKLVSAVSAKLDGEWFE